MWSIVLYFWQRVNVEADFYNKESGMVMLVALSTCVFLLPLSSPSPTKLDTLIVFIGFLSIRIVFSEVVDHFGELMVDLFGNYLCQVSQLIYKMVIDDFAVLSIEHATELNS